MLKLKLTLILFLISIVTFAQFAHLRINLSNTDIKSINLIQPNKFLSRNFFKQGYALLKLDEKKSAIKILDLKEPQFFSISCYDPKTKNSLNYDLYLSPGDNLTVNADFNVSDLAITVTGKGANNNQFLSLYNGTPIQKLYKDTVPNRIISELNKRYNKNLANFETYKKQHQPSTAFVKDWELKIKYDVINSYYSFKENNKFQIKTAYDRNAKAWEKIQDSLSSPLELNNDAAIHIDDYLAFVRTFLLRKKEALWMENSKNPEKFYLEWYKLSVEEGKKLFIDDSTNDLSEKIINRYFSGKTAEYLYVVLLEGAIQGSLLNNLIPIFDRFKDKYPENDYVALIQSYIDPIVARKALKLNDKMVFAKDDGVKLNTLEEVLALTKGKTVLLDMWGTWCGPCLEEIEKNGKAIKDYYKNKDLDYVYIANFDIPNAQKWKELIPYFNLEGIHILANNKLTKDIMQRIKGNGYPTYLIIKKDGTFELSKAGYPMELNILFKQIDIALALNTGK